METNTVVDSAWPAPGGLNALAWRQGERISSDALRGDEDPDSLWGHYAMHHRDNTNHLLCRDALGVHKLFYALGDKGELDVDPFLHRLLRRADPSRVFSVPPGALLRIDTDEGTLETSRAAPLEFASSGSVNAAIDSIAEAYEVAFDRLRAALSGRPLFVTLSGGLDSSCVAALASRVFPELKAITFRLDEGPLADGEDLAAARRVAEHLKLELIEVHTSPESALELVDEVLLYGQDPRDFNVHCGMVNAVLARTLQEHAPGAVVLSGDGSNELMADYTPVEFDGRIYYDLPRLDPAGLRRYLVSGLDVGDREVGIFARFGVEVVQPFLLCARAFARLPASAMSDRYLKGNITRSVTERGIDARGLPEFVFERPKVRAQCGRQGEPGGTMALLARAGLDQNALSERFAELYGVEKRWLNAFIRAGVYRRARRYEQLLG